MELEIRITYRICEKFLSQSLPILVGLEKKTICKISEKFLSQPSLSFIIELEIRIIYKISILKTKLILLFRIIMIKNAYRITLYAYQNVRLNYL